VSQPASLTFLARHEIRLAWRDWLSMLTAGKARRIRFVTLALVAFALFMHLIAFSIVAKFAEIAPDAADRGTLVVITACAVLAWSLMMSQAMESVTRAFYARSDLDLILSSPVASRRVFAVRLATMAASTVLMAVLLAAPFINILVWRGGPRWFSAYGVVIAVGALAAGLSVALTVALFRTIGPKRTRIAAQIVAAIVGATFVIGLQIAAIFSFGTLSYFTFLKSDLLVSLVPAIESMVWWPARAVLGDMTALAAVLSAGALLLAATIAVFSARFGDHAIAAAGVSDSGVMQRRWRSGFRRLSPRAGAPSAATTTTSCCLFRCW
jgi:ABC-2 type transport system permease protein